MMTINEYRDYYKGMSKKEAFPDDGTDHALWIDARDMMETVLRFDHNAVIFPDDNGTHTQPDKQQELRDALDSGLDDFDEFNDIIDNVYHKTKQWKCTRDYDGDLDIDQWVNQEDRMFNRYVAIEQDSKSAITVFINMYVGHGMRNGNDVADAYNECYRIAAQCEADSRPCRVVGVLPVSYRDHFGHHAKPLHIMIVLKDFDAPIFPAIWAGIKSNRVCNSLICMVAWYVIGANDGGAGSMPKVIAPMSAFCDADDEVMTFGRYIKP
jgi:hypothetical protein